MLQAIQHHRSPRFGQDKPTLPLTRIALNQLASPDRAVLALRDRVALEVLGNVLTPYESDYNNARSRVSILGQVDVNLLQQCFRIADLFIKVRSEPTKKD